MKLQEALAKQFGMMYATAASNLEGIDQAQSLITPEPSGNCLNWILGHMVTVHNGLMMLLGEAPVWENERLSREKFFKPVTDSSNALDWNTLRDKFLGSRDRCLAAISRMSDETMADRIPDPFGGETTRGELLNVLAYHQAYHVGQLGVVRRIAGLEGKVKGPGQAKPVSSKER
jgi:uncharacterized damage-inducible protein DinB